MPTTKQPKDIAEVNVDGQVVYYRPGEVIAVGEPARDFVLRTCGRDAVAISRDGRIGSEGEPTISSLPPAFIVTVSEDPVEVLSQAQESGHRVELNHVFFTHGGASPDPCCGVNPPGAFPPAANPYKATPYKATPYKATSPADTSAVMADAVDPEKRELGNQLLEDARPGVNVWIIDTGISDGAMPTPLDGRIFGDAVDHPDKPPLVDGDVDLVAGHGTFIAGIIEKLAPGCDIKICQVIEPTGDLSEADVARTIHELLMTADLKDLGRTILNLSFGGSLYTPCHPVVGEAIATAQEAGVVVVASAGNEASCLPSYPANFPGVVSVGAVDSRGFPAEFTNRGPWVKACALGVDIVSTFFDIPEGGPVPRFDGWAIWSGTSFATPVVVAAIAKEMAVQPSANAARDAILERGTPVHCLGVRVDGYGFSAKLEA